jgi:hypothetical protein
MDVVVGFVGEQPALLEVTHTPAPGAGRLFHLPARTPAGPGVLDGTWSGGRFVGTWRAGETTVTARFGDGIADPVFAARQEVWTRAFKGKSTDQIPVSLPTLWVADEWVQSRLDAALAPERIVETSRSQAEADGWIDAIDCRLARAHGGIAVVEVWVEGSGAYPDGFTRSVVLDLRTGDRLGVEQFAAEKRPALVGKLETMLQERISTVSEAEARALASAAHATPDTLTRWTLADAGVVFTVDFGFPHAIAAMAPDGRLTIPWAAIAEFTAPDAPLLRARR